MAPTAVPAIQTTQSALKSSEQTQVHEVNYKAENAQVDADLSVKWNSWMSDGKKNSFYKEVFVLLISWHPDYDDLGVGKEVKLRSHILLRRAN